ncbi:MAG TPA: hypothetical protein VJB95_00175 [Candidatus Paceibacterota bacterium]
MRNRAAVVCANPRNPSWGLKGVVHLTRSFMFVNTNNKPIEEK